MEEGKTPTVEVEGHDYFVVDQDLSKGDRRCDGPAMATFFNVEAGSATWDSVRERHRSNKRRDVSPPPTTETPLSESMEEVQDNTHGSGDVRLRKKKAPIRMKKFKRDGKLKIGRIVALRPAKPGIQCAGRNDTTRLLWLHEYCVVHEGTSRKGNNYIYQAVQFAVGEHVPCIPKID
jgi:hypothetical protein